MKESRIILGIPETPWIPETVPVPLWDLADR